MSQFAIHQDFENQAQRRGKTANTRGNGQKRAVLGVITNQVNQNVRVQPSRAAKPKVSPLCPIFEFLCSLIFQIH